MVILVASQKPFFWNTKFLPLTRKIFDSYWSSTESIYGGLLMFMWGHMKLDLLRKFCSFGILWVLYRKKSRKNTSDIRKDRLNNFHWFWKSTVHLQLNNVHEYTLAVISNSINREIRAARFINKRWRSVQTMSIVNGAKSANTDRYYKVFTYYFREHYKIITGGFSPLKHCLMSL